MDIRKRVRIAVVKLGMSVKDIVPLLRKKYGLEIQYANFYNCLSGYRRGPKAEEVRKLTLELLEELKTKK